MSTMTETKLTSPSSSPFPLPLITTPIANYPKDTDTRTLSMPLQAATTMAIIHNSLLRSLNSIHAHAVLVHTPQDIQDLLFYTATWHEFIHEHHATEESAVFPALEKLTGTPGSMEANVAQHQQFEEGLGRLEEWLGRVTPETYKASDLQTILESFATVLQTHLADEIGTLLGLEGCDEAGLKQVWLDAEKVAMKNTTFDRGLPFMLGAHDGTFEDGRHASFIPLPWFMLVLIKYWWARKHKGAWRFAPCTFDGVPRKTGFETEV